MALHERMQQNTGFLAGIPESVVMLGDEISLRQAADVILQQRN